MPAMTGPFSRTEGGKYYYRYQQWYRQKPPYRDPLPYKSLRRSYAYGGSLTDSGSASALSYDPFSASSTYGVAYAKAYANFKDKLGEAASLAVNIAERKQALDAFAKRTMQIVKFARALKKFRFGEAAEALGLQVVTQTRTSVRVKRSETSKRSSWNRARDAEMRRQRSGTLPVERKYRPTYRKEDDTWELRFKRRASAFGSNYLEYHFGWEPLMKDIVNTFDIFNDPMRDKKGLRVVGRGSYQLPEGTGNPAILFSIFSSGTVSSSVSIRARVRVSDENLYRAEQLGLLNPLVLAWELVPFSFIVDWFVNVGDYLASMTDFVGLKLTYPSTTHVIGRHSEEYYQYYGGPLRTGVYDSYAFERSPGISGPSLIVKPTKWPSVTRGLTAISLLTGLFGTVQHRR